MRYSIQSRVIGAHYQYPIDTFLLCNGALLINVILHNKIKHNVSLNSFFLPCAQSMILPNVLLEEIIVNLKPLLVS